VSTGHVPYGDDVREEYPVLWALVVSRLLPESRDGASSSPCYELRNRPRFRYLVGFQNECGLVEVDRPSNISGDLSVS